MPWSLVKVDRWEKYAVSHGSTGAGGRDHLNSDTYIQQDEEDGWRRRTGTMPHDKESLQGD